MTPEGQVKKDIKAFLNHLQESGQVRYFMPQNMGMGESGVADFVGVHRGRAFAFEAKRADTVEYATPWQFRFLTGWRKASGIAHVVRSVGDVVHYLELTHPNDAPIDKLQPDRTE